MDITTLTWAQKRVMYYLVQGYSNTEIAAELGIAEKTAKGHVTQILQKTGCKSRSRLIAGFYRSPARQELTL